MTHAVRLHPERAAAVLQRLAPDPKKRIRHALRALADDPSPAHAELDIKRLATDEKEPVVYRLRVGEWRVVFAVRGSTVYVNRIFHRSEGYGWMES